ncbi:Uu.00g050160.m01.CDS01 [Anthostomella pinea]|uniref:Uu.00g050160.m01.CDS01 n=1 Tax=Anthostomella pinea TaxID=933095 RepID=A0AAI8VSN0_9PEZI|nr:Uu.00g050160.m01.CDS01 [Anthostomella pinea]
MWMSGTVDVYIRVEEDLEKHNSPDSQINLIYYKHHYLQQHHHHIFLQLHTLTMYASTAVASFLVLAGLSVAAPVTDSSSNAAAAVEKRFAGGWCTLHIREVAHYNTGHKATITIYDANQFQMYTDEQSNSDGKVIIFKSQNLPKELDVSINFGSDNKKDEASFVYGDTTFGSGEAKSSNAHCKVGQWDIANTFSDKETLDMDCGFTC